MQPPPAGGWNWGGADRDALGLALGPGIPEGALVRCRPAPGLPPCSRAVTAPSQRQGPGSYEALGLQAGQAEGSLLQQAGVVCEGQPLMCWVGGQPLELDVLEVVPPPAGRLAPGTEVIVLPACAPMDSAAPVPLTSTASMAHSEPGPVSFHLRLLSAARSGPAEARVRRVAAGETMAVWSPLTAGVHPATLSEIQLPESRGGFVELFPRRLESRSNAEAKDGAAAGAVQAESADRPVGAVLWCRADGAVPEGHILVSEGVLQTLELPHLGCVDCRPRTSPPDSAPQGLEISIVTRGCRRPGARALSEAREKWKALAAEDAQRLLPELLRVLGEDAGPDEAGQEVGGPEEAGPGVAGSEEVVPEKAEPLLYDGAVFDLTFGDRDDEGLSVSISFKWGEDGRPGGPTGDHISCLMPEQASAVPVSVIWGRPKAGLQSGAGNAAQASLFPDARVSLVSSLAPVLHSLHCRSLNNLGWNVGHSSAGFLLVGPPGSGKSTLLREVAHEFEMTQEEPGRVPARVIWVNMGEQKSPAAARKAVAAACAECVECQPAVLVLDDIDAALGGTSEADSGMGGVSGPTAGQKALVAALEDLIAGLFNGRSSRSEMRPPLAVIASARSASGVPPSLKASGLLCNTVEMPPLGPETRRSALVAAAAEQGLTLSLDAAGEVARRTEGYGLVDLNTLTTRARLAHIAAALERGTEESVTGGAPAEIRLQSLEKALEGFVPGNARGASAKPVSPEQSLLAGWGAVGGMPEAVGALREALELPGKHAEVFSSAPLRLRSGCLLYGPSGCGKTYLAGAAARACGLRFVAVKGPELLNKYIGQSEAGVRGAFHRATSAAPCVLFFDEFDALAPRRGQDNTGVTDRVVNQLLAELDGVEKLQGVFVVAASSRPDLLDPALLRPGRLDRLVYCGFPNFAERLEILEVLRHGVRLSGGASLEGVARLTEGFSGADLRALMTDSQLCAAKRVLRAVQAGGDRPVVGETAVEIAREDLDLTVASAKPSFGPRERERLEALYAKFKSAGQPAAAGIVKRSTLA